MSKLKVFVGLLIVVLLSACGNSDEANDTSVENETVNNPSNSDKKPIIVERKGIRLTEFKDFPKFSDGILELIGPVESNTIRVGENAFEFKISNFNLGVETVDDEHHQLAHIGSGQHVVFIKNGEISYNTSNSFSGELNTGDNYIFASLASSYFLSVKNPHSYVHAKMSINEETGSQTVELNPDGPHLIAFPLQSKYVGKYAKRILLDFFLINTEISEGGNYVEVIIDNVEFKIYKWAPYIIEGLNFEIDEFTQHEISMTLKDKDGKVIESPFNSGAKRKFYLKDEILIE